MSHFNHKIESFKSFTSKGNDKKIALILNEISDISTIPILGSDNFINLTKEKLSLLKDSHDLLLQDNQVPSIKISTTADIISVVSKNFNITPASVQIGFNNAKFNLPRKIAIYLSYKTTKKTQNQIAEEFGNISRSQVASICSYMENILKENCALVNTINKIKVDLEINL